MSLDAKLDPITKDLTDEDADLAQWQAGEEHQAEAQAAGIMLATGEGGWAWDVTFGLPYLQLFLGDSASNEVVSGIVRAKLLERPGIRRVEEVIVSRDRTTKQLTIEARATTTTGETVTIAGGLT